MTMPDHITVKEENCAGCLRCALACSFYNSEDRVFSLSEANITIRPGTTHWYQVGFRDDCIGCGMCVDACQFGTLIWDA